MKKSDKGAVFAAGAIVWRVRKGELEVLAVHRPAYKDWSWPKGKVDKGETLPACAIREVAEETGVEIQLGQPLPTQRYALSSGKAKVVKYWIAQAMKPSHPALSARPAVTPASPKEIDKVKWMTIPKAHEMITLKADRKMLDHFVDAYDNERLETRAFIVARHARAKRRKAWFHDDVARPITKAGEVRAQALVPLFSAFGVRHVHSSPAERCLATVRPYAEAATLHLKEHSSLTEHSHGENPAKTAKTMFSLLGKSGHRVVCVHRPTLPTVVTMIEAATRKWTRGALPRHNPFLPAGGVMVAHVLDTESGPRIVALETHLLK